jgi:hypothetical protein
MELMFGDKFAVVEFSEVLNCYLTAGRFAYGGGGSVGDGVNDDEHLLDMIESASLISECAKVGVRTKVFLSGSATPMLKLLSASITSTDVHPRKLQYLYLKNMSSEKLELFIIWNAKAGQFRDGKSVV